MVIGNCRVSQFAISCISSWSLTVRHREEVYHHLRCRIATTACISWTDVTLPTVVLHIIGIAREVNQSIIQGYENCFRILGRSSKHIGKRRSVHTGITLTIKAIATSVDCRQILLHGFISILDAIWILSTIEQWATPKCQHTAFQCQCSTRSYTTVVFRTLPTTVDSIRSKQFCRLIQIRNNKLKASLSTGTLGKG